MKIEILIFLNEDYVGEELLYPLITYSDMRNFSAIQIIDLGFQVDHITPEKIHFWKRKELILVMLEFLLQ